MKNCQTALKSQRFLNFSIIATLLFLFFLAAPLHAQGWMLNDGGRALGSVPVRPAGRATLVAFDRMAELAGVAGTFSGSDFRMTQGQHSLILIGDSAAAWLDSALTALPDTNTVSDGHCWVDSVAALRLLSDFLKKSGRPATLSWGGAAAVPSGPAVDVKPEYPISKPPVTPMPESPAPKPTVASKTVDPVPKPLVPPRSARGSVASDFPELKALRWGVTRDKIRIVADITDQGTPQAGTPDGKVFLKVAPISASVMKELVSPVEEVTLQAKNNDHGEVALLFPGLVASVVHLEGPRRIVIDVLRRPASGGKGVGVDKTPAVDDRDRGIDKPNRNFHGKPPEVRQKPIVVVDAGHGGKDPGASKGQYREKVIALQIAKQLQTELQARKFDVRMTRTGDTYPTLKERPALANSVNADLFISIHLNALPAGRKAKGVEIYFMALPTDKDAMELARIENAELLEDGVVDDSKTDMLMSILGNLQQNAKITESTTLAEDLFAAGKRRGLNMRRVAQAPFAVLRGAAMPAVLVETGFITDQQEAKLLASPAYQKKMAAALADGIEKFLR